MNKLIALSLMCLCFNTGAAEYSVAAHQEGWDNIPPEAVKPGFYFQRSVLAQMDDDPQLEEVMLFGRDYGHYPDKDLFKAYYAIVDNYTKEVEYISDSIYVTDRFNMLVEDRNNDGVAELYFNYFKDGKFSVDEEGYNMKFTRCFDRVEWSPEGSNFKSKKK